MSVSSRTPDDKLYRYLQRIDKLVGNRGKSPVSLIKSRTKSPVNIKTPRIDNYLHYQLSFKRLFSFFDNHKKNVYDQFFQILVINNNIQSLNSKKEYSKKINQMSNKKKQKEDKFLQVRFFVNPLKGILLKVLKQGFENIKGIQKQKDTKNRSHQHRRIYSQIYEQTIQNMKSKSQSPFRQYESKSIGYKSKKKSEMEQNFEVIRRNDEIKQVVKKNYNKKQVDNKIIRTDSKMNSCINKGNQMNNQSIQKKLFWMGRTLSRLIDKKIIIGIFQIKNRFMNLIQIQNNQSRQKELQHQKTIESLKKQISTYQEVIQSKQELIENLDRSSMISFEIKMREEVENFAKFQFQNKFNTLQSIFTIFRLLSNKTLLKLKISFYAIQSFSQNHCKQPVISNKNQQKHQYSALLIIKTLKFSIQKTLKQFLSNLYLQNVFNNFLRDIQQKSINQSNFSITSENNKSKSCYSVKKSNNSISSVSQTLDDFSTKINKAFSFKNTLKQIYSYSFQKIDFAALLYLSFSKPLSKLRSSIIKISFRRILIFSFIKRNQQISDGASELMLKQQSQNKLKLSKGLNILKLIEKKYIFVQIQAYSLIKLHNLNLSQRQNSQQFFISQKTLKKQIDQFLQQRKKCQQKTLDNWQKTKLMLINPS